MFVVNLAVLLAALLNSLGLLPLSSPYLALGLYYYAFLWMPGYLLVRYFFRDRELDPVSVIPWSFAAGYAFFLPWVILAYLMKASMSSFVSGYLAVLFAWVLAERFVLERRGRVTLAPAAEKGWVLALLAVSVGAGLFMADHFGGFISGNFLAHVSVIRKLAASGIIEQRSSYFIDFPHDLNVFSAYHVFLALVSRLTRIDPVTLWVFLPPFIFPIALLAQFVFARSLFSDRRIAALYLLGYLVYYGFYNPGGPADGHGWLNAELAACNNITAWGIFMPLVFAAVIEYQRDGNRRLLFLLPLLLLAQGSVHLYVQTKTYFILFALLFWALVVRPPVIDTRRFTRAILISSVSLVFFVYVFLTVHVNVNPYYQTYNTGGGYPIEFFGAWPLLDAGASILKDPLTLAGTLLCLTALPFVRSSLPAFFLVASFFSIYAVLFNPVLMRLGGIVHPSFERISRLYNVLPFCAALVWPLALWFSGTGRGSAAGRLLRRFTVAGAACVTLLLLVQSPQRLSKISFNKQSSLEQLRSSESLYAFIRGAIPAGSVVMVNLPLTTWWTTYFPHYIVAHAFDFVLTPDMDQTARKEDVRHFYAAAFDERSEEILEKYGVGYVFFLAPELGQKDFAAAPYLEPVRTEQQFAIYRTRREREPQP